MRTIPDHDRAASDLRAIHIGSSRDLILAVDRADARARYLARAVDRADARARASGLASAVDLARDLALARELTRDLDRDLDRVSGLARDFDRVSGRAFALARAVDLDRALTRDLDRALARVLDRVSGRALGRAVDLAQARDVARALDHSLDRDLARARDLSVLDRARASSAPARVVGRRVVALAGRLLAVAAWMLPAEDRVRYGEEFRSEVWEIARAGGGRCAQLAYASRQVARALRVRAALRAPRRRGAIP